MNYWNAKYPNEWDEYEITFSSNTREVTMAVEKVCTAVMDGLVKSPDDVEIVVHAHWIRTHHISPVWKCSNCGRQLNIVSPLGYDRCFQCGAHMDEEVADAQIEV